MNEMTLADPNEQLGRVVICLEGIVATLTKIGKNPAEVQGQPRQGFLQAEVRCKSLSPQYHNRGKK